MIVQAIEKKKGGKGKKGIWESLDFAGERKKGERKGKVK